jgi:hypothetical protein
MANANIARGLIPVRHRNGAPYTGTARMYHVPATYATALFVGDPVIFVTDASDANGIPTVTRATAAGGAYTLGPIVGMVSGGDPPTVHTQDKNTYRPASTLGYVLVADDPDLLFEIQEDSVGGVMTVGAAGRNADFIAGTGSTTSGYSGFMIDSSTLNTTNTLQLRIVEAVKRADNDPTLDYAKWLVSINLHSMRNATGV